MLIKVLEYRQCSDASFFRNMKLDEQFVIHGQVPSSSYFTEFGVYKALMKSNKPIAD